MFMQTTKGLIVCVVIPILLLVGFDFIRQAVYERRRKKDTDALLAELEALRAEKEKNKYRNHNRYRNRHCNPDRLTHPSSTPQPNCCIASFILRARPAVTGAAQDESVSFFMQFPDLPILKTA